jgi:hypothetical protein
MLKLSTKRGSAATFMWASVILNLIAMNWSVRVDEDKEQEDAQNKLQDDPYSRSYCDVNPGDFKVVDMPNKVTWDQAANTRIRAGFIMGDKNSGYQYSHTCMSLGWEGHANLEFCKSPDQLPWHSKKLQHWKISEFFTGDSKTIVNAASNKCLCASPNQRNAGLKDWPCGLQPENMRCDWKINYFGNSNFQLQASWNMSECATYNEYSDKIWMLKPCYSQSNREWPFQILTHETNIFSEEQSCAAFTCPEGYKMVPTAAKIIGNDKESCCIKLRDISYTRIKTSPKFPARQGQCLTARGNVQPLQAKTCEDNDKFKWKILQYSEMSPMIELNISGTKLCWKMAGAGVHWSPYFTGVDMRAECYREDHDLRFVIEPVGKNGEFKIREKDPFDSHGTRPIRCLAVPSHNQYNQLLDPVMLTCDSNTDTPSQDGTLYDFIFVAEDPSIFDVGSCGNFPCDEKAGFVPKPNAAYTWGGDATACCDKVCSGHQCPLNTVKRLFDMGIPGMKKSDEACCEQACSGVTCGKGEVRVPNAAAIVADPQGARCCTRETAGPACPCLKRWVFDGKECTSTCCSFNGEREWCATDPAGNCENGACKGKSWGFCAE